MTTKLSNLKVTMHIIKKYWSRQVIEIKYLFLRHGNRLCNSVKNNSNLMSSDVTI